MISDTERYSQYDDFDPHEMQQRAEELENIADINPDKNGIITCPILPLRDVIIFPHMVAPLPVGRRSTLLAIKEGQDQQQIMLAIPQRNPNRQNPKQQDFFQIGVTVAISEVFSDKDGQAMVLAQGRQRVEVQEFFTSGRVLYANGKLVTKPPTRTRTRSVMPTDDITNVRRLNDTVPDEAWKSIQHHEPAGWENGAQLFAIRLERPSGAAGDSGTTSV